MYPRMDSLGEYSFFAEACFPTPTDRRSFFQRYVKLAVPFLGYRLIPLLVKNGVLLTPEIIAKTMKGEPASEEATKVLRNAVYGYQHNDVYDADLRHWTGRITGVDVPDAGGQHFLIGKTPFYAGLYQPNRPALNLKFQRFATFGGFVVEDAKLVFLEVWARRSERCEPAAWASEQSVLGLLSHECWSLHVSERCSNLPINSCAQPGAISLSTERAKRAGPNRAGLPANISGLRRWLFVTADAREARGIFVAGSCGEPFGVAS